MHNNYFSSENALAAPFESVQSRNEMRNLEQLANQFDFLKTQIRFFWNVTSIGQKISWLF